MAKKYKPIKDLPVRRLMFREAWLPGKGNSKITYPVCVGSEGGKGLEIPGTPPDPRIRKIKEATPAELEILYKQGYTSFIEEENA